MIRFRSAALPLAASLVGAHAWAGIGADPLAGPEFQINTYTTSNQLRPAVGLGLLITLPVGDYSELIQYQFAHPRIRALVYGSMVEADKQKFHLKIAGLLSEGSRPSGAATRACSNWCGRVPSSRSMNSVLSLGANRGGRSVARLGAGCRLHVPSRRAWLLACGGIGRRRTLQRRLGR